MLYRHSCAATPVISQIDDRSCVLRGQSSKIQADQASAIYLSPWNRHDDWWLHKVQFHLPHSDKEAVLACKWQGTKHRHKWQVTNNSWLTIHHKNNQHSCWTSISIQVLLILQLGFRCRLNSKHFSSPVFSLPIFYDLEIMLWDVNIIFSNSQQLHSQHWEATIVVAATKIAEGF